MKSNRFDRVICEQIDGRVGPDVADAAAPESFNFRIVSHFGDMDWSPYGTLSDMRTRFDLLPAREDGFFKLVEG